MSKQKSKATYEFQRLFSFKQWHSYYITRRGCESCCHSVASRVYWPKIIWISVTKSTNLSSCILSKYRYFGQIPSIDTRCDHNRDPVGAVLILDVITTGIPLGLSWYPQPLRDNRLSLCSWRCFLGAEMNWGYRRTPPIPQASASGMDSKRVCHILWDF